MNKEKTLEALEEARDIHIEQMYVIEDYFNGDGVDKLVSMDDAEDDFREIFYAHKEEIYHVLGAQFYKRLDQLHQEWHQQYEKIDKIFFRKKRGGILAKLFSRHKISYAEHQLGIHYYHELKEITGEILYLLDASMRRVAALKDSTFEN